MEEEIPTKENAIKPYILTQEKIDSLGLSEANIRLFICDIISKIEQTHAVIATKVGISEATFSRFLDITHQVKRKSAVQHFASDALSALIIAYEVLLKKGIEECKDNSKKVEELSNPKYNLKDKKIPQISNSIRYFLDIQSVKEITEKSGETSGSESPTSSKLNVVNSPYDGYYLSRYISTYRDKGRQLLEERLYHFSGENVTIYSKKAERYSFIGTLQDLTNKESLILRLDRANDTGKERYRLKTILKTDLVEETLSDGTQCTCLLGTQVGIPKGATHPIIGRILLKRIEDPTISEEYKLLQTEKEKEIYLQKKFQKEHGFKDDSCRQLIENEPFLLAFFTGKYERDKFGIRFGESYHLFERLASKHKWFYNLLFKSKISKENEPFYGTQGSRWYGYFYRVIDSEHKSVNRVGVMRAVMKVNNDGLVEVENYLSNASDSEKNIEKYFGYLKSNSADGHWSIKLKRENSTAFDLHILLFKQRNQYWGQFITIQSVTGNIVSEFLILEPISKEETNPTTKFIEKWSEDWNDLDDNIKRFVSQREYTVITTPKNLKDWKAKNIEKQFGHQVFLALPARFTNEESVYGDIKRFSDSIKDIIVNELKLTRVYTIFDDFDTLNKWEKGNKTISNRFKKIMMELDKAEKLVVVYHETMSKKELLVGHSSIDVVIGIALHKGIPITIFRWKEDGKETPLPKLIEESDGVWGQVKIISYSDIDDLKDLLTKNPKLIDIRIND